MSEKEQTSQEPEPSEVPEAPEELTEIEKLQQEKDELFARLQRAQADLQNFRKRAAQERKDCIDQTQVNTIELFVLPLIDDLDRALQAAEEHGYRNDDPLFHGVDLVRQHAFKMLKHQNIEPSPRVPRFPASTRIAGERLGR